MFGFFLPPQPEAQSRLLEKILMMLLSNRHRLVSASQSEKLLLFDTVQSELEEKIRRLEEDRHSIDITSGTSRDCNQHILQITVLFN